MRRTLTAIFLSLAVCSVAFGQTDTAAAHEELVAGARSYRDGDFAAAEQHFRRSRELDPTQKNIQLFIARAVQQQYKPGVQSPENIAVGERAVAAYQEILQKDTTDDDAFKAVIFLYGQMRNEDKVRDVLLQRANDGLAPNEMRAEAFVILASKQWNCSFDITEQKENKSFIEKRDRVIVIYKMPRDATEFYKAKQCVNEGLQFVEQAIGLDQNSVNAWSYKANLLREASKLAEMEGNKAQKADYDRQFADALATHKRLGEEALAKQEANEQAPPASPQVSTMRKTIVSGGVLNGKAVYKPAPEYPAIAKAARAQGTVTVQILVDEDGNVAEAKAVSGHPLLQQAAVEAARQARFTQTRLGGQPVRVSGVVTYNFVLQ